MEDRKQRSLTLELKWPPTTNKYYRHVGRVTKLSQDGRRYREAAMYLTDVQFDEPVSVQIALYPPKNFKRWDVDNRAKAVLDALEYAGILSDDSLVHRLVLQKQEKVPDGMALVVISTI